MDKTYRKFKKRSKQWTVFYHCSDLKVPRDRELLKAKFQKMSVLIEYRRLKFVFCRVLFLYNPRRASALRQLCSAGGGGVWTPPSNSTPGHRKEKQSKRSKLRKESGRNDFSHSTL